jgi:predicted nucleotidyltransferase
VTAESEYLRALARRVVDATIKLVPVRAALLAGSAARDNADSFSDLDLIFYVDQVPTNEALADIRTAVGGVNPLRRHEPTEYANGEEFQLEGVRTEVLFTTVERVERQLDQLLDQLEEINSPRQKFLSGIAEAMPLHGEELISGWQARLRDYPEPFRRAMIERHWDFFPLWYYGEAMAARDSELWRLDVLLEGAFNLLDVLAGLNRIYFARFELKRTHDLVAKMTVAPPALADRIEALLKLPPAEAAAEFGTLIEETRQLVRQELPELDLPLPFPPGTHQQPWSLPEQTAS